MNKNGWLVLSSILVTILLGGLFLYPYLPFNLDFRTYSKGYRLEDAFPDLSFDTPVDLQIANDDTNLIFVVEQTGIIKVFENEKTVSSSSIFLDIRDRVEFGGERGLLGLAFHPNYSSNGLLYVDYTTGNPLRTRISQFQVSDSNPNSVDKGSEVVIFEVEQPYTNHNAGSITFGPKGYLYITLGDGGAGNDPHGNGQNTMTYLGSILRIDVDNQEDNKNYAIPEDNPFINQSGYLPEIYAYGLRNPWKISWDMNTNTLWAGDVGQNRYEEIDIIEKGGNYGWNIMEATYCFDTDSCDQSGLILPVVEYGRTLGKSVTGGYTYYGQDEPGLVGKYLYGDYITGRIWYLDPNDLNSGPVDVLKENILLSSFGVVQNGEILVVDRDGSLFNIVVDE